MIPEVPSTQTPMTPEVPSTQTPVVPRLRRSGSDDLTGRTFGNWTVSEFVRTTPHGTLWRCECKCGTVREVWGAQLKAGRSRSCGQKGCRMRAGKQGASIGARDVAPEDRYIFRTWIELMEILEEDNWRCRDARGTPYLLIRSVAPNVRSWEIFRQWTRGEFAIPEYKIMKQSYVEGKVLASVREPTCRPLNKADPCSPSGVIATYMNLEWVWPDVAEEEGRMLVVRPPKVKWYLWEGVGPAMTRAELTKRYGMTLSTFNSRLIRGWTIKEACHGKKERK